MEVNFEPPGLSCAVYCSPVPAMVQLNREEGNTHLKYIATPQMEDSIFESGVLEEKAQNS